MCVSQALSNETMSSSFLIKIQQTCTQILEALHPFPLFPPFPFPVRNVCAHCCLGARHAEALLKCLSSCPNNPSGLPPPFYFLTVPMVQPLPGQGVCWFSILTARSDNLYKIYAKGFVATLARAKESAINLICILAHQPESWRRRSRSCSRGFHLGHCGNFGMCVGFRARNLA